MAKDIDTDIRKALDAKAHEVDVPNDLAQRTLDTARDGVRLGFRDRLRGRLDAWRVRAPVTGYPRWMYAGAAIASIVLLFAIGSVVTPNQHAVVEPVAGGVMESKPMIGAAEPGVAQDQVVVNGQAEPSGGAGATGADSSGAGTTTGKVAPDIAPVPPVPGPSRPGQFPPKIVKTANIEVEVRTFDTAWNKANAVATRHGGFVTSSSTEQVAGKLGRGTLVIRVPATKLDAALNDLRGLGKVTQSSSTGEDVSAQIVDVEARVHVLEAEELQLLELLKRASGVSQIIEVRDRLNSVRQELESLKAQKEYFANQVAYSTINATVFERGAQPSDEPPGDGIIPTAWRTALRVGLTIVAGLLVVLGGLIPLAGLGFAVWAGVRVMRRRRA